VPLLRTLVAIALVAAWTTACGRTTAPPTAETAKRPPACSLISRAEMSQILNAPIGKPIADDSAAKTACAYPPGEAGSWAQAEVAIEWEHRGGPTFEKQMTDAFGGSAVGRQVAHQVRLGDDAAYSKEGVLSIRQGTALITVTLPMRQDSEIKATAVGRKLLERLGGALAAAATPSAKSAPVEAAEPPAAKSATPANDTEEALKGLMTLFGDDDKPDPKEEVKAAAAATPKPVSLPLPDGFEPEGSCPDPGPTADADLAAAAAATIPLEEGLTLTSMWTNQDEQYDHECLRQVTRIDHFAVTVTNSCPSGADRHTVTATRRLCRADMRDSYIYVTGFSRELPETMRGALAWSLSAKSFAELTTAGSMRHRFLQLRGPAGGLQTRIIDDDDGRMERKTRGTAQVIVNDQTMALPVIEASGHYTHRGQPDTYQLTVIDDARFPIVLDYRQPISKFSITYTKVSFPTTGGVEKHLAVDKRVDVYGIYFDFASDRLRPESGPVLREISEALTKNPSWRLTINGHTDNVGGDAMNLDLSKRRSASVRRALAETYHIDPARLATAGFGASQPKESNVTADGRAKNRRVELVRQ
jgi:outer membrane protein OmpA-like peptidoglycan-associated protein